MWEGTRPKGASRHSTASLPSRTDISLSHIDHGSPSSSTAACDECASAQNAVQCVTGEMCCTSRPAHPHTQARTHWAIDEGIRGRVSCAFRPKARDATHMPDACHTPPSTEGYQCGYILPMGWWSKSDPPARIPLPHRGTNCKPSKINGVVRPPWERRLGGLLFMVEGGWKRGREV